MLNVLTITGRLVADPDLRATQQGTPLTSFRIAVSRNFANNGERETDFFEVIAWRGTAEFICNNFRKGSLITIVGRIQNREWTDKHDQKRVTTEIVVEQAFFGESKPKDGRSDEAQKQQRSADNAEKYDSGPYYTSDPADNYGGGGYSPLD